MSYELDKTYDPARYESILYSRWEDSGAFKPNPKAAKDPFTIIMPPPNANGDLHLGHAMYVVEDLMIRYRRMQGHKALWLPGADHAGIETQVVYERQLAKHGKSRFDLGRDKFYSEVWDFTQTNMQTMISQVKKLGFSVDWSRMKFTLDQDIIDIVYDTFKRLHDDGYVYRGNRIVNWCPYCRSAFADIEVKYREQLDPLYYIKYGPFVLATVRPETKFGDTAIAVHPDDERYKQYVGKTIDAEGLLGPFKLKVIADNYVNPDFGTGAVKVTPAHDPNDWEMGQRHSLEVKQVIGTDGLLTEIAGRYGGMPVAEAREQVAHDLEERGLMDHIDMDYSHSVGYHDRCGTLIEPLVVEQWWLKVSDLKKPVTKAIKDGHVKFVPGRFTKVAIDWMDNLKDWNISRQNWWGIRIPVYYSLSSDKKLPPYIIGTEEDAIRTYGIGNFEPETDNFDTWFSSGQWPFATLMATGDFDHGYYPTSVMETGRDILFQWVTRMIMLGLYRTDEVPFRTVYLHGLINDEHGKKMSKSKGNVINPLDMTEKYGTDAVRLALTIGITPGNDGALSVRKIEGYRNFCNKLWNVARFILGGLPGTFDPIPPQLISPADHWLMQKLNQATRSTTKAIEDYRFSEAGQIVYSLLWDDFADWYLEASKVSPNHDLLVYALETILKLLHPIAPFVSEAIWSEMPWHADNLLITTDWPTPVKDPSAKPAEARHFENAKAIVQAARTIASEEHLSKPDLLVADPKLRDLLDTMTRLARAGSVTIAGEGSGIFLGTPTPAWIAADEAKVNARREHLAGQLKEKEGFLASLEKRLGNSDYVKSAPASVVQETRDRRVETVALISKLTEQLKSQG